MPVLRKMILKTRQQLQKELQLKKSDNRVYLNNKSNINLSNYNNNNNCNNNRNKVIINKIEDFFIKIQK